MCVRMRILTIRSLLRLKDIRLNSFARINDVVDVYIDENRLGKKATRV